MSLFNFIEAPKSIKQDEIVVATPPSKYEAFLYRYTHLNNGKMYVGIHKGVPGDGYWHSSKNKEFNSEFSSVNPVFRLEILRYGSYDAMQLAESRILNSVNAKENSMYYNGSNGTGLYLNSPPDVDLMEALADKIAKRDGLAVTIEPVEDIAVLKRLQVRLEEDEAHKREIRERIEDAGGNTSGCSPVVIYERRGPNGEDIIGDGNHTVLAASEAKHCTTIPVIRIPKSIHQEYTDAELKGVGGLLNKKPETLKKANTPDDAIKQLEDVVSNGVTLEQFSSDEHSHRRYLQACGFTNKQITKIISKVKKSIERQEFLKANKLWIDYTKKPHKDILEKTTDGYRTSDQMAIHVSSAMFKWDNLLNTMFAHTEETKKRGERNKVKHKMVVVVHHKTNKNYESWKQDIQPQILNKINFFFKPLGYSVTIHEMPTTMTNNPFMDLTHE